MSDQLPILILLAPLFGAIAVSVLGLRNREFCLPIVFVALAVSLGAVLGTLAGVVESGTVRYFLGGWDSPLGIGVELRVDLMSGLVLVVIAVVAMLTALYSVDQVPEDTPEKVPQFYALYLFLVTGLLGMTITADAFNLYVLLEVSSLASYALIAMGKSKRSTLAAFHYIIMGTIGASFYLIGVGYLYIKTGTLNMEGIQEAIRAGDLFDSNTVFAAFIFLMVGVAIKMAYFPLYGWLPNAYSFAPATTACLLAPLMTKVSIYVMIRIILTVFGPEYSFGHLNWKDGIVGPSVLAILAGSVLALAQVDLKKMLCYLIVAEVGYMVGGIWLANHYGMVGAIYHIISDAFMTLCLFLAAGIFFRKTKAHSLSSLEGLFRRMPLTMAGFATGALAMIGVPPTCGFFSKWYLIRGGMEAGNWLFVGALLVSSLVNAILFFRIFEVAYFGRLPDPGEGSEHGHGHRHEAREEEGGIEEAPASMLIPLLAAAASLVLIGIFNADLAELIARSLKPYGIVGDG